MRPPPIASVVKYRFGVGLARALPIRVSNWLAYISGWALPRLLTTQAEQVSRHQQRFAGGVLGPVELRKRVRRTFESYSQYWVRSLAMIGAGHDEVLRNIEVEGQAHSDAAFFAGKGAICVMPHIGLWDLGGAWLAGRYRLTVVAERLEPKEVFDWFVGMRAANGMEVVALGDVDAAARLSARLRAGGFVGLLCDRDIAGDGVPVTFFGEETTMSAGPAMLSLRTGAPILPTVVYQRPGRPARGVIRPPIEFERTGKLRDDVAALTQLVADALAELIRESPEQWHVLHPNWPSDRVGQPSAC
jgi:phosphatidylinositol dimannoside acyltransferase